MATDLIVGTGAIVAVIFCSFIAELPAINAMRSSADEAVKEAVTPEAHSAIPERVG